MKTSQKGFSALDIILVIVALAAIGAAVYFAVSGHKVKSVASTSETQKVSVSASPSPSLAPNPYAGWQSASFSQEGLTIKYPSDWSVLSQYVAGDSALIIGQHPLSQGGLDIFLTYAPPADLSGGSAGISGNHGYTPVAQFKFNNQTAYIIDDSQNDTYWLSSCAAPSLCFFPAKSNASDGVELYLIDGASGGQYGISLPSSSNSNVAEALKIIESISY